MTDKGTSGQSVQKSPELTEGLFLMDGNFWDVPLPLPELWEAVKWAVKPDGAVLPL